MPSMQGTRTSLPAAKHQRFAKDIVHYNGNYFLIIT